MYGLGWMNETYWFACVERARQRGPSMILNLVYSFLQRPYTAKNTLGGADRHTLPEFGVIAKFVQRATVILKWV